MYIINKIGFINDTNFNTTLEVKEKKLMNTFGVGTGFIERICRFIGDAELLSPIFRGLTMTVWIELIDWTTGSSIRYSAIVDETSILNETLTKTEQDGNLVQRFALDQDTIFPEQIMGLSNGDEISLSDVVGNIKSLYTGGKSILLNCTKTGMIIRDYLKTAKYVQYEEDFGNLCTAEEIFGKLEELGIKKNEALEQLHRLLPLLGFGIKGLNDSGLAVIREDPVCLEVNELGSGYKKLFALLPIILHGGLVFVDNFSASLHPNLERVLVNDLILGDAFEGQLISQFR